MIDLRHGDAHELIATLPDAGVDAIITDPPYGVFQQADAHLDTPPRPELWHECYRVARRDAFLLVFGRFPSICDWHAQIVQAGWKPFEDMVWYKAKGKSHATRLWRVHEYMWIYAKGNPKFYDNRAPFSETRLPLMLHGLMDIRRLDMWIRELEAAAMGNPRVTRHNPPPVNGIMNGRKSYTESKRNPARLVLSSVLSYTAPWYKRKHPFEKPLPLLERLVRLLTCEGQVVLDPFLGSGTTAVACAKLGRACIGFEHNAQYLQIAQQRVREAQGLLGEVQAW